MIESAKREVIYRIDGQDRITQVNTEWERFARENETFHLEANRVVGTVLWDHLGSSTVIGLHQELVERVRKGHPVHSLSFRCDAPALRRYMEMTILPLADGALEYRCAILRVEAREPVPLLAPAAARSGGLLMMCSWCKRVAAPEWMEVEQAVRKLALFEQEVLPRLSHGICEDCVRLIES